MDENKDKVSEKSHKIISLDSYLRAAPILPLQAMQGPNALGRASRAKKHCSADIHCTPLKSSGVLLVFTPVALKNKLRNELRS